MQRILDRESWNRNATASALGITRRSLYRLIQKYDLANDSEAMDSSSLHERGQDENGSDSDESSDHGFTDR